AAYKAIDPDSADATADPFPEGAMIVKQNLDAAGEPTGAATVMAKQAAGFNPDAGDWYWGRFEEDGSLAQGGVVDFCIDCHASNGLSATDWVNGVPPGNQL
ncbi:MAG: cytochrome P460 family protein, partial [Myxococcales bacterium]|nr:cytochrome P460 family protein [Myxococcales bacterium]